MLSPKERANLKAAAHHLKPIHHIGREGVTEATLNAVAEAFNQRELIKIRLQQSSPVQAREAGPILAAGLPGVEHVQTIGRTIVLYRPRPAEPASDGGS